MMWTRRIKQEEPAPRPAPLQYAAYMVVHGHRHTVIDGKTRDRFENLPEHEAWQKYAELMEGSQCQSR